MNGGRWRNAFGDLAFELAVRLMPRLADLVALGVEALLERLAKARTPISIANVAYEIVAGLERDYPDKLGEVKRKMAQDAIRQAVINRHGTPDDALVNVLLELAVNEMRSAKG